ncbi:hypothetical protein REC12_07000 [Desulfosporosinus sp. PR]|uniref:hypothetical protein n=1 Tax=Candidatus Desulfosporosinus nitrosoreducens TaxID=3401928 RepID=UPI0027F318C4|nr:hypothetical protein [Desulfosporosinus sp. PR]MDQ7093333.1 hypothetical protein [Desulfosporosinus sp. PR]
MIERLYRLSPYKTSLLLGMMGLNFFLTGIDVFIAHSQNDFFRWEVIPLVFTPLAVLAILIQLIFPKPVFSKRVFQVVMWVGVLVGVLGTFFHLTGNAISGKESYYNLLVAGSPVAAPVAFAGISCYALASRHYHGASRRSKLLILVGLGFLGAVLAAYFDHARLGFKPIYTLIPLVSGTLAALSCFYMADHQTNRLETTSFMVILALNMFVGLLGFGFHIAGNLAGTQTVVWARFLYRNPVMGPLLFCNLALLGAISILPELQRLSEGEHHKSIQSAQL